MENKKEKSVEISLTFSSAEEFFKFVEKDRNLKVDFAVFHLKEILDYINSWEKTLSLKSSDFEIKCLKSFILAKIDVLKKRGSQNGQD